jgi:hypothetical protein
MDRRGFLGIMVIVAAGCLAGMGLVKKFRKLDDAGLKEAMFYKKV